MNAYSSGDVVHHPLVADVGEGFVRRHALGVLGHALHSPGEQHLSQSQFSPGLTNHSKVLIIARPPDACVAVLPGLGVGAVEVTGHGGHAEAGLAVLGQRTFKQTQCKYRYISSAYFSLIRTATTLYPRHDGTIDTIAIAEILNFQSYVFHVQSVFHVVNFTDDCS